MKLSFNRWWDNKVSILNVKRPENIPPETPTNEVIEKFKALGIDQLPIVDSKTRALKGVATMQNVMVNVISSKIMLSDPISKSTTKMYSKLNAASILGRAFRMLEKEPFIAIERCACGSTTIETSIVGFITMKDLFEFISMNKALTEGIKRCRRSN